MIFEEFVKENRAQFIAKVRNIAMKLAIEPEWLMAVMYKESRLNHKAYNAMGGATGLIQFMPATAKGLGTTTDALRNMSNLEQLDYVYKYFRPYVGRIKSYSDLYMVTFFPAAVGKPGDTLIGTKQLPPAIVAKYNPGVDLNKDGKITVAEFASYSLKGFSDTVQNLLKKKL